MHEAQLAANDAMYYYFTRSGRRSDWPMWWVFDNAGGTPASADLVRYVTDRAEALEPLRRRIHEVPAGLGHPFWEVDDSPVENHVTVHSENLDWAACLDRMGRVLEQPLDARVNAWQLHIFADVSGIPTLTGTGTVVMIHVSHALMAGPAMTSLSEALFAPGKPPLEIEGLGPAARRPPVRLAAVRGALGWPVRLLRFVAGVRAENRRIAREGDEGGPNLTPRTATILNQRISPGRAVRTFPVDLRTVRVPGTTVTAVGLTAVSQAMQRYLDKRGEACPDDLAAFVTIAVPGATVMGVNRVGADVVDLHPATSDPAERAQAVDGTLRVRRASATSRRELERLGLVDMLPSRMYRAAHGTLPPPESAPPTVAHTVLTSIRCEPSAEWSLLDKPFRFAGMLPPVYPDIGLAHSFVGAGDSFAVSVVCDPALVDDIDGYCDILQEAFDSVAAALTDSR
ncbi:wax ester/triacylglycerol synthase domain-containing protein [Nocardia mexicana]|uniref:Wax ester synthase-like acyl-CoA acyltransferase family protein n=1 Tax=Nocardia mexicana TaxID=279262 RepID=A0A370H1V8_9NOCA|nr:wax ester/triacylglycerol synthase domain-containing protein [Nocardia mexicana]RDI49996.1 wax ester synthase-like acyl-CoA acyltransferase family protein [Nocardia mexicana]